MRGRNDVSPTKLAALVSSPRLPTPSKGMGCPCCAPRTRRYLCKVTACRGDVPGVGFRHAWDSGRTGERQVEREWMVRDGVGKSQRRAKRRAVTREISEAGARKTKQKVRIKKAGREIKKIHPARNSTSCQADSRCCLGKS